MRQGLRGTYAKETNAADNGGVLGRGQDVVGGAEESLGGATRRGALDNNSLGRHLEGSAGQDECCEVGVGGKVGCGGCRESMDVEGVKFWVRLRYTDDWDG